MKKIIVYIKPGLNIPRRDFCLMLVLVGTLSTGELKLTPHVSFKFRLPKK